MEKLKSQKHRTWMIIAIVFAVLLVVQSFIIAWLIPKPVLSGPEHEYLNAVEIRMAANAFEREFYKSNLPYRGLLLKITYRSEHSWYLKDHPELDPEDVIVFDYTCFTPDMGGLDGMTVVMGRNKLGVWYIISYGI